MTYREHIQALARDAGVKLFEDCAKVMHSYANYHPASKTYREIHTAALDTEQAYWAALHEMGHVHTTRWTKSLLKHLKTRENGDVSKEQLKSEADAWLWAVENAAFPMTYDAVNTLVYGIETYAVCT